VTRLALRSAGSVPLKCRGSNTTAIETSTTPQSPKYSSKPVSLSVSKTHFNYYLLSKCQYPQAQPKIRPLRQPPNALLSAAPHHMLSPCGTRETSPRITMTLIENFEQLSGNISMMRSCHMRLNGNQLAKFQIQHVTSAPVCNMF
jgi:hypothetical protein